MAHAAAPSFLHIRYHDAACDAGAHPALGLIRFDETLTQVPNTSLVIRTGLRPLHTDIRGEVFSAHGAVQGGHAGHIRFAGDGQYLLAQLEIGEAACGSLDAAAAAAYRELCEFNTRSGYPHVLRMWNYMDRINQGDGDAERYRQFCAGRARGFGALRAEQYPAASAIGRQQATGTLLIYWLASRAPGQPLENPRQVSAWRYPRAYGPVSPSFARACLLDDGMLMISGTASIVGHASCHHDDVHAQLHETLNNIDALIAHSRTQPVGRAVPDRLGAHSLLKIYVRDAAHAPLIRREVEQRCGAEVPLVLLGADICRRELLLEIDCVHGLPAATAAAASRAS